MIRPRQIQRFASRSRATRNRRRHRIRPQCEPLEGRVVPSTFRVTSTLGSGRGTLRAAIQHADACGGADTIKFAPSVTGTIVLKKALPALTDRITIAGPGASVLTVAHSSAPGTRDFRIFTVGKRAVVKITGLTVAGGVAADGGGIQNSGSLSLVGDTITGNSAVNGSTYGKLKYSGDGGGVENFGKLTVTDSTLSNNSASGGGPIELFNGHGGGIENSGTLTVTDSTLSNNSATGNGSNAGHVGYNGGGGGITSTGKATVVGTTFSGNSAAGVFYYTGSDGNGGGIENAGTMSVTNSSFVGNTVVGGQDMFGTRSGPGPAGLGGGIENSGTLSITGSTFSGNLATTVLFTPGEGARSPTRARSRSPPRRSAAIRPRVVPAWAAGSRIRAPSRSPARRSAATWRRAVNMAATAKGAGSPAQARSR